MYQGKQQFEDLQAETLRKATNPVEKHKVRTNASKYCQTDSYKNFFFRCHCMYAFSGQESLKLN